MDKIAHIVIYAVIGFIASTKLHPSLAIFLTVFIGIIDEFVIQPRFKSRVSDWKDLVADIVGTLIGVGLYVYFL